MSRRDAFLLVTLGALWGSVYPLTSVALRELSPASVVLVRTGLASLVLSPLAIRRSLIQALRGRYRALLVAALLQATVPLVLLTVGQQHISSGLAGILVATQPVWATVMSACLDRTFQLGLWAGMLLGLVGVALLFLRDVGPTGTTVWGAAAVLGASLSYAAGAVWIERAVSTVPPLATATTAMVLSATALAPFAFLETAPSISLPTAVWLIILGGLATGVALVLFYTLIQRIGAARANLAGYLAPGFAVVFGVTLLGESVSTPAIAGLALILLGSYMAALR